MVKRRPVVTGILVKKVDSKSTVVENRETETIGAITSRTEIKDEGTMTGRMTGMGRNTGHQEEGRIISYPKENLHVEEGVGFM